MELTSQALNWWPSPAKLNLFLHINGRYDNGYHQLQSLFQLVDFGDQLAFQPNQSGHITLATDMPDVPPENNLIIRASLLLKEYAKQHTTAGKQNQVDTLGCTIHIDKRLPMGGGIGGGSSNAATCLVALNFLWELGLSSAELQKIGLTLGADVPIFVNGHSAFAEGVGEKLQNITLPEQHYLVVFPDCHVSTAQIFQHPDLPRNTAKIAISDYNFDNTKNDCQQLVCDLYPNVANTLHWLIEYAPSRMTGTGACVFAIFEQPEYAMQVQAKLPQGTSSFIARGVNTSPLHTHLQSLQSKKIAR